MTAISAAAVSIIVLSGATAFAQRNRSQAASVVIISYQRVVAESALGRDVSAKLAQVRAQVGQEAQALAPESNSIEQERQRLAQASRNMSPEQIRNSATLAPQVEAFQQRVQQFQARGQGLQGDMECSQAFAFREFDRLASPIIRSVMAARGAGAVIEASTAQTFAPEYDITTTVIQQLDQNPATRTANVTRHALAECQAQQPAAAQAPAQ